MRMRKLDQRCNLSTVKDGRGIILTFFPEKPIVEFNLLFTKAGETRGFHYHEEFDEYALIASGHGVYVEKGEDGKEYFLKVAMGDCVYFPRGTPHTLYALVDMRAVAMLTKKWDDCKRPIVKVEEEERIEKPYPF